ncbi:MAG TPA: prolyl oligopeptidase family serine peptidase, partial [Casimicrobiaceae bacterium]|nr:prolyl oligopeptidase family serine peptidase [Casimicrobiaceae bacterium]
MRRAALALAFLVAPLIALAASDARAAPLPVETFFRRPAYGGATLSPNGRFLAVVAPVEGRYGLIVVDLDTKTATKMRSPDDGDVLDATRQNDQRLVVAIGDVLHAALDKYGKPHEWVVYNDEGHGFSKDENLFDFYGRVERFLAKHLGPVSTA